MMMSVYGLYVRVTRQCLSLDAYRQHRQWIFKHQQQQAYVTSWDILPLNVLLV